MAVKWESTVPILHKMKLFLTCSACNNLFKDPCSLSTCHHEFCRKCIDNNIKCLRCGVPYWNKDIVPFSQLNTLVQQIESLEHLIIATPTTTTPKTRPKNSTTTTASSNIILKPKNHRWASPKPLARLRLKQKRRLSSRDKEDKKENIEREEEVTEKGGKEEERERRERQTKEDEKGREQRRKRRRGREDRVNEITSENQERKEQKERRGEEERGRVRRGLKRERREEELEIAPITKSLSGKRNCVGETKLHVAVIKGDTTLVRRLLEEGADPNVTDNAGWTPLHEACNHGYSEIVELLIAFGSLLNVPGYNNDTPLHDAVQNNHPDIVTTLLRAGAKTQLRNCQGHTPADLAYTSIMKVAISSVPVVTEGSSTVSTPIVSKSCPVILGSGLTPYQRAFLTKTANKMGARVVQSFSSHVTHVVTECDDKNCCSRTMKCLSAIAIGAWLLNFQWVVVSSKQSTWEQETDYLIKGFNYQSQSHVTEAPLKGYTNALEKLPGLFDGCSFYFVGHFTPPKPSKEELTKLVQYAGGRILTREPKLTENDTIFAPYPFHAPPGSIFSTCHTFIITDSNISCAPPPSDNTSCLYSINISLSWILDCLCQFELVDFRNYNYY